MIADVNLDLRSFFHGHTALSVAYPFPLCSGEQSSETVSNAKIDYDVQSITSVVTKCRLYSCIDISDDLEPQSSDG